MSLDKKDVFKEFVEKHDVLIVDKNASSRNRLLKTIVDLGCKRNMVHTAGSLAEAEEIIASKSVGIVLSDYMIGGGSGFDLFKVLRSKYPTKKDLCLVLVTSNISQSAVAKAAEEDVDSFVIKPYTVQSIQENLLATIHSKVKPPEYIVKIEEGKDFISARKYDEAIAVLNEAVKLHAKPALALFYIGQAEYLKNQVGKAESHYNSGLSFINIHYKCLVGLFDIFMKEKKYNEAYEVVRKIAKFFPANPERLKEVIHLAVRTEHYEDMNSYYEIFTSLEERDPLVTNYVGAGLYISGKHSLLNNKEDEALKLFENFMVTCSEFTRIMRAIITLLVEFDKFDVAEKCLGRFPAGSNSSEDYLVSDFLIMAKASDDPNSIIKAGLALYNKNVKDSTCLSLLIDAMEKAGHKEDRIQPFRDELTRISPPEIEISA